MQINITRRNGDLSESLKDYIEKKLIGLTRHYQKIIDAHVIMDREGKNHRVEISLKVTRHTFFAKDRSTNLRSAIDSCVDKLDKQLIKLKGKIRRKTLTPEEAVLKGRVILTESGEIESVEREEPVLTFEKEEIDEEPEKKTGT